MQKDSAKNLIQDTLQNSFNKEKFIYLTKNILNHIEEAPFVYKGNFIFDDFADSIKTIERIGKYKDPEGKLIDILIVRLQKETSLERARTKQRNFVAKYLKGSRGGVLKDAALAAFVSPNGDDWRFSLVKMEYKFNEKGKVEEEFTPARRYSFLVGKNENSHTAQSRLLPLLLNDEINPSLEELEDVFSVEKVTKEFFEKYRALFLRLKESLDEIVKRDPKVKADFKEKNVDTVDFAKKLLGQIIFLYFLQKKGWLGVPRGKDWGEGDKKFLRNLFDNAKKENKNYFNRFLEPLFYEALRLERPKDYYDQFNCRIPFLNGGLFDPINEYDWQDTDIEIPNDIFSNNRKTKEGDTGDGILDVFDRYNFTVKEDEPLEKEVAIDPEMLGKVFENLLEVKDRKSKGTYYTPREIVHYMCQESLTNYLATELEGKATKEEIETLIKYGELVVEHDSRVVNEGRETKDYSFKLPSSVRKHAQLIDEKLASIRVCDPAVGSGAFPVGMMNEIIRTRNALTPYIGENGERSPYHFKRQAIQNCLYGVDIDPGAVEIAKLRLWLSLIVDEEDREKIKPLPNLDYKIMQGNSLLSEFMGIDFDKEDDNQNNQLFISQDDVNTLIERLKDKKDEYLNKASAGEKQKLKKEIEDLMITIFETKLQKQKADYFSGIKAIEEKYKNLPNLKQREALIQQEKEKLYKTSGFNLEQFEKQLREYTAGNKIRPFFSWKLYFAEIFHEKKGFDVVIGNPPYLSAVQDSKNDVNLRSVYRTKYPLVKGAFDVYVVFLLKGAQITNKAGSFTWIVPNKLLVSKYAEDALEFLKDNGLYAIVSVSSIKVFEANVYPIIILGNKLRNDFNKYEVSKLENLETNSLRKEAELDKGYKTIKEVGIKVSSGATGFQAKQLAKYIKDTPSNNAIPFVVSGSIDPYIINLKDIRYMNKTYKRAFISKGTDIAESKWRFWNEEKIIIAGMTKRLEATYSDTPLALGVGTYAIYGYGNYNPKFLLGLLNSAFMTFYVHTKFKEKHLAGGYIAINKSTIEQLPIVIADVKIQTPIIKLVDKILAITKDNNYLENPAKQAKVREYEKQIDQLVYKLYGLTDEEIKIVEDQNNDRKN